MPLTLEALRRYAVARTLFAPRTELTAVRRTHMDALLAYVQERGVVHPREVDGAALATRRPWPMNWSTWVPFCI